MVKNIPFGYGAGQILTHRRLQILILSQADARPKIQSLAGEGRSYFNYNAPILKSITTFLNTD